jgi:hypothetical protein
MGQSHGGFDHCKMFWSWTVWGYTWYMMVHGGKHTGGKHNLSGLGYHQHVIGISLNLPIFHWMGWGMFHELCGAARWLSIKHGFISTSSHNVANANANANCGPTCLALLGSLLHWIWCSCWKMAHVSWLESLCNEPAFRTGSYGWSLNQFQVLVLGWAIGL